MGMSRTGMAIVDLQGRWLEVNPAFERLLGSRADELVGQPLAAEVLADLLGCQRGSELPDIARRIADEQERPDVETRLRRRDGSMAWVQAHVGVMGDANDAPQWLLVQVRDVSAQRIAEADRQALVDKRDDALDASQRQLQLFTDAVAHDLRAPLRAIGSFSALLADRAAERLDDTDRDYLRRIRAAAERMSGLLQALSALSSATSAELKPAAVDMSLLAEWVGAELQDAEPERSAQIVVQPGLRAWGDEHLLKQLLAQLMGNAWKFSRERERVHIEVGGQREGDALRMTVRDAGIGFDPRYAHKLFEPFQRLHGPDQGGGHGLGLAIAQRIAERHGGGISAESRLHEGASFTVALPAADEDASHA
jgi:PAS domain S-box-containing protein